MNRIERLIQELCPDGVPRIPLGELLDYLQPTKYIVSSTDYAVEGTVPVLTAGKTFLLGYTNDNSGIFNASPEEPVILFDDFTTAIQWVDFPFKIKSSAAKLLISTKGSRALIRYVYFILEARHISSTDHKRHWISETSKQEIPVPPIEVQREIVRILDKFSALEAELEAELEARRKQYEFYRSALVNGSSSMRYSQIKLSDIIEYVREYCSVVEVDADTYVGVDNLVANKGGKRSSQYVPDSGRIVAFCRDDILFGNIRPYLRKIWLADASGGCSGDVLPLRIKHGASSTVVPRYLYHALASEEFFNYMGQHSRGGKMPRGDKRALMRYVVSVPPVEEQKRIADILDRFDALVNDISIGLPAELEARRKQYEYYRDKLLTFKELPA